MRGTVGAVVLVLLIAAGCDDGDPCKKTCRAVAACKLQAKQGAPMLGEGSQPADPTCMSRCEAATPEFAACEGKHPDCAGVMACIPYADR